MVRILLAAILVSGTVLAPVWGQNASEIAVTLPATVNVRLPAGNPAACYRVTAAANGGVIQAGVSSQSGRWAICWGDGKCPGSCVDDNNRQATVESTVAGRSYFFRVETLDPNTSATLNITGSGGAPPPAANCTCWTVITFKNGTQQKLCTADIASIQTSPAGCTGNTPPPPSKSGVGRVWHVRQWIGSDTWTWTWTRRGDSDTFDAVAKNNRTGVTSNHVISLTSVTGNKVVFFRPDAYGSYLGVLSADGKKAQGTVDFAGGGWEATIE